MGEPSEVAVLLSRANEGDAAALRQAFAALYGSLRAIARRHMAREASEHTLETDALVHEAYLRMVGLDRMQWRDGQHVLAMAARTMRRVLVDHAERRRALKRRGVALPLAAADAVAAGAPEAADHHLDTLHALDEALVRLEQLSARQTRVVECRFFAGLSVDETAAVLGLSPATVKRDWTAARAWLNRELGA